MTYSLGPDGQTIYHADALAGLGSTPEQAAAITNRLNSPSARQEDVDLLLWLLAEARDTIDWWHRMSENHVKTADKLIEERDAARMDAAFWSTVGRGAEQ